MKKREYFLTATLAYAVAMIFNSASVSAAMFPIVVKQGGETCTETASVRKTGQNTCYDATGETVSCTDTGQDGDLLKGVAWPSPRFTDNNNGTVTDNLTGLVWTRNADCYPGMKSWQSALEYANTAADSVCGIADGSSAGTWRLPNIDELLSLVDREYSNPALSNAAGDGQWSAGDVFTDISSGDYWSSTTYVTAKKQAWRLTINTGVSDTFDKISGCLVWLVRD